MQYVGDYDERMPGSSANATDAVTVWTRVDPYLKSKQIVVCPSAVPRGVSSYGYNYFYLCLNPDSGCRSTAQIGAATLTVLATDGRPDTARDFVYPPTLWQVITDIDGGTAFGGNDYGEVNPRHFEGANIAWCDGHVKWQKLDQIIGPAGDRNRYFDLAE